MKKRTSIYLLILFCGVVLPTHGETNKPRGAKELFFDPTGSEDVLSVRTDPSCQSSDSTITTASHCERRRLANTYHESNDLGISYWIELVERPGDPGRQVTESRVFRSGERIRLHFLSNSDGLVSLLQIGSSGKPSMLFPDPSHGLLDNFLQAGVERILPTQSSWFRFDNRAGTEKIIVVFAADQGQLDTTLYSEPRTRQLDSDLVRLASTASGSKDLVIETEEENYAEIGTYAVSTEGQTVVLEIALRHE